MPWKLTDFEKQVYDFIKEREEVLISSIPLRMKGAIPNLKNAGLVKIHKRYMVPWASKKQKFVTASETDSSSI
ncbi:MAG: hypothetical protein KGD61_06465 [Candidatus Lokiarchaeota archaeon]|nr:hypothetical protein [Candidatus Lokiarchaeota archaeon]